MRCFPGDDLKNVCQQNMLLFSFFFWEQKFFQGIDFFDGTSKIQKFFEVFYDELMLIKDVYLLFY